MAKYDQGGGCPCGLFKECSCEGEKPKKRTYTRADLEAVLKAAAQEAADAQAEVDPPENEYERGQMYMARGIKQGIRALDVDAILKRRTNNG